MADDPDDMHEILSKLLDEMDQAEEGDPALSSEPYRPAAKTEIVGADEGLEMVADVREQRARDSSGRYAKSEDPAPSDEAAPVDDEAGESPAPVAEAAPSAPTDLDALLDGMDDDRKAALRGRIAAAEEVSGVLAPFADVLKGYGETPKAQVERLAQVAAYASTNPQEYLAWAAETLTGGKAAEALAAVAERFGLKLAPAQDEPDDPFEDPDVKKLREEVKALRAQTQQRAPIGPDSPAWQAQTQERAAVQSFQAWRDEKGPDGKPLRPLVDMLGPQLAERMTAIARTGRAATMDDLTTIYADLHKQVAEAGGFAAQSPAPVAQPQKDQAAPRSSAVERARAASKSIGGTGQGAPLRPASPGGLDTRAALLLEWDRLGLGD